MHDLGQAEHVWDVDLHASDVDDAGLDALMAGNAIRPSLGRLNLGQTRVDDAGMRYLSRLPMVERLVLPPAVTDRRLDALTGLTRLEDPDLEGTKVSDLSMAGLVLLPKLSRLNLSATHITGRGLRKLAPLVTLTDLDFGCNTLLTDSDK